MRSFFKFFTLPALFVTLFVFAGCSGSASVDTTSPSSSKTTDTTAAAAKEITITAQQWNFQPATVTVKKGDNVKLLVTSKDVTHGFSLPEFNVNSKLTAGQTTEISFVADKVGTFEFECNVICGKGHGDMQGTFIVEE